MEVRANPLLKPDPMNFNRLNITSMLSDQCASVAKGVTTMGGSALLLLTPLVRGQGSQFVFDASGNLIVKSVEISAPPQILAQPRIQAVGAGELASFFVVVANTRGLSYQWLFNDGEIAGATHDALLLENVASAHEGNYKVVLTNAFGSVTSEHAALMLDSDGDGLPDSWEQTHFGNLNRTSTGDFDNDGVSNLTEFLDGTIPSNNASALFRLTVSSDGGTVSMVPSKLAYMIGEMVTLTATPFSPNTFHGWTGSASTQSNSLVLAMNSNKSVRAEFDFLPPPPGLVGWWRAEGNAFDAVGTNHGSANNGASYVEGKVGQGFVFDGVNDYVNIPDAAALRPESITLEAWASFNSVSGPIIARARGSGIQNTYILYLDNNTLKGFITDAAVAGVVVSYHLSPVFGQWYHLGFSFDNVTKEQALYVNGVRVATVQSDRTIGYDTHPVLVGGDIDNGVPGFPFNGRIDEAAIYNRALTTAEMAAIHVAGIRGKSISSPYFTSAAQFADIVSFRFFNRQVTAVMGTGAITFAVSAGSLPAGLTLSSGGTISGTPTAPGSHTFAIRATDANGTSTEQLNSLQVLDPAMPAGLVAWWRAESNALDAADTNHGVATNGATYASGKVGQSFIFDGVNDYVTVPDVASLRPASVTLEAWVSFNSLSGPIIARTVGSGIANSYILWLLNGNINGVICDINGVGIVLGVPFTPVFGQWYHLAFSFDDLTKQQALYVNGTRVATGLSNRSIGYDNHPILLGGDIDNGAPVFLLKGRIDEASIYNRALRTEEVASIYHAGAVGKVIVGPYINTAPLLPPAFLGGVYNQSVAAFGGTAPILFAMPSGALPPGLTMDSQGLISGTPTNTGTFGFVVRASDGAALTAERSFSLQVVTPVAPPPGIISWWRAETTAQDAIGPNHGVATNGATYAVGKVGQGFVFDGVNDYVSIPDAPSLRPASVTLEAWAMFNLPSGPIIARTIGSVISNSYILWVLNNGTLNGAVCDSGGATTVLSTPFTPVPGQWYHLAYTFDDLTKQQALHIDGVSVATGQSNRSIGYDNHPVLIGGDIDNGTPSFLLNGRIDEAAIYGRALTAGEVAGIHTSGAAGKRLLTLIEQWKFTHLGDMYAPDSGDPDGDGQDNLFEYTAGLVPNNPASRFRLRIAADGGVLEPISLIFSPRFNDRTYSVTTRGDLGPGVWIPLSGGMIDDKGTERTVTDSNLTPPVRKFYRVEITKP